MEKPINDILSLDATDLTYYRLDLNDIGDLKMFCSATEQDDKKEMTFNDFFKWIGDQEFIFDFSHNRFKINSKDYKYIESQGITKRQRAIFFAAIMLKQRKMNFFCEWYFYKTNYEYDDERAHFFLAENREVSPQTICLPGDEIDVLVKAKEYDFVDIISEKAEALWLYKKFYNDTYAGQVFKLEQEVKEINAVKSGVKQGWEEKITAPNLKKTNQLLLFIGILLAILVWKF